MPKTFAVTITLTNEEIEALSARSPFPALSALVTALRGIYAARRDHDLAPGPARQIGESLLGQGLVSLSRPHGAEARRAPGCARPGPGSLAITA